MKDKASFFLGIVVLIIPYFFWFYLGEDSFITIHDNLDSEFVYILKLLENGQLFSFKENVDGVMNGLPRFVFRSPFNFTFLLFFLLKPIYAYIANHLFVHLIGFLGMYILLTKYFIKDKEWLQVSLSLCFGLLSYYHIQYGISISGQPILLFAFLNILYKRQKWYDFFIIAFFPFYSFIIVTLPFFIPLLIGIGIWFYLSNKTIPKLFIISIIALCIINLLVEFPLIYGMFFNSEFISHRTEWDPFYSNIPTFKKAFDSFIKGFELTQYHSGVLHPKPILISILVVLFSLTKKIKYILYVIIGIMVWVSVNKLLIYPIYSEFSLIRMFNSERFYFLLPFLWLLLFGLVLNEINYKKHLAKIFAFVIIFICIKDIYNENIEFKNNLELIKGKDIAEPTFKQFFDTELFAKIKTCVGESDSKEYSFLSLGLHPSIAQFNNLKTLDSYQNNYPLAYKQEFRKIMEMELSKSNPNKKYFDYWGSRCYLFSSETGLRFIYDKNSETKINDVELNIGQINKMGGKYIISSVPILDFRESGLEYLDSFETENSFWKLYLYETI